MLALNPTKLGTSPNPYFKTPNTTGSGVTIIKKTLPLPPQTTNSKIFSSHNSSSLPASSSASSSLSSASSSSSTSSDRVTVNSLESTLGSIFDINDWNPLQHQSYTIIRRYVDNFRENNRIYETKNDKLIIRNNFKDQIWFIYSKSKPIMSQLLDVMELSRYVFEDNEYCVNLLLVVSFGTFKMKACFYKNKINNFLNYFILFENNKGQRAYLTYYTVSMGSEPTENTKKLKLPEFEKIYLIISINPQMFYQYDLLNFFSEIVMYYDESEIIGNTQISQNLQVTLNQLMSQYNNYIHQKNSSNGYNIV
jgi:hypothetical protein